MIIHFGLLQDTKELVYQRTAELLCVNEDSDNIAFWFLCGVKLQMKSSTLGLRNNCL